jgi:serine/threonine protein kinase
MEVYPRVKAKSGPGTSKRARRRPGRRFGRGLAQVGPAAAAEIIGSGQYGVVTRAAGNKVRKTYKTDFAVTATFLQQFAARCSKHVPPVLGIGLDKRGRFYQAMPHCGVSLHQLVRQQGPIANPRFAKLADQIVTGVADLWREGLVHGDLKLDNILVGADDRVWLIDFDIAVAIKERTFGDGNLMYAAALRPPEMLARRADMLATPTDENWLILAEHWALGMVLWAMAAGLTADFYAAYRNSCTATERLRQLMALFGRDDDLVLYSVPPELNCPRVSVPPCMAPYMSLLRIHWAQRQLPVHVPKLRFTLDETPWQRLCISPPSDPQTHRCTVDNLKELADAHSLSWRVLVMARVFVDAVHEVLRWTPPHRLVVAAVMLSQALCRATTLDLKCYSDLTWSAVRRTAVAIASVVDQQLPIGTLVFFQDEARLATLYEIIDRSPEQIQYYRT